MCLSLISRYNQFGVILFRRHQESAFSQFCRDTQRNTAILRLDAETCATLADVKISLGLDFDDAYQLKVAESNGLSIVTMDSDFRKVENRLPVIFI
jgi:predicted nucleic acid-binding protein